VAEQSTKWDPAKRIKRVLRFRRVETRNCQIKTRERCIGERETGRGMKETNAFGERAERDAWEDRGERERERCVWGREPIEMLRGEGETW
jgi:hypothetical protein